jgi:hypothetical protein
MEFRITHVLETRLHAGQGTSHTRGGYW